MHFFKKFTNKISCTIYLLMIINFVSSQDKKTVIAIGTNIVDDTFTANYKPFNISEQWNIGKTPSYFTFSSEIVNKTYLGFNITTNEYKKGKLVNGNYLTENMEYLAIDILLQYKIFDSNRNSPIWSVIDPFLSLGFGTTKLGKSDFKTLNYGFGFNIWIPNSRNCNCSYKPYSRSNFGLVFSSFGKSSFEQKTYGNQIQHTIGLCYRFQ